MGLTLTTAPASEPVTLAEVMAHLRLDDSSQEAPPAAPSAALVSPAAPGNVDNGAHRYLATFVTADGETQAGTPCAAVTVADKAVNGKVLVSAIPLGGSAVTARKLYRTLAGGSTYYLLATVTDNSTTSYTDNIADASLGAGAPSTNTTGDPLLSALITTARQQAEHRTGRALVTQQWKLTLDYFPGRIELPRPALVSVQSVKYLDADGVQQTFDSGEYQVVTSELVGYVQPAYGKSWPVYREQPDAIEVNYTAGYGAASAVPRSIKAWILMAISTLYSQRDGIITGTIVAEVPRDFCAGLLDPYCVVRV